ncbi:MAG: molybdopterin molybdotransferase MoeA [Actinomycetales bacterium]|nr:molybdopterin molybdotransferase MoeA [Actinomycetales bacterium]
MREVAEHRAAVLALARLGGTEELAPGAAAGRVLATPVTAHGDLPPWDCSAMDGYAVRAGDLVGATGSQPVPLTVVGESAAGAPTPQTVASGTAVRIMTGAPLPPGADAVVRQEDTDIGHRQVSVSRRPRPGENLRTRGDDTRAGDVVLAAGADLGPAQVAAAAGAGVGLITVRTRPRVAVISTGAELVAAGSELGPGQIHDSNSVLLAAAATAAGAQVVHRGSVGDDVHLLRAALAELEADADLVLTSGGVSVGAYDVVKAALSPEVDFVRVAMQPGKPQGAGHLPGGTPVVCLPGNPVSAFVSFEVFVRPLLRAMLGASVVDRPLTWGVADDEWDTPAGRAQYMPVALGPDLGVGPAIRRATAGGSGSHLVAGLARAGGLAVVPAHVERVRAGDRLAVIRTESA